MLQSLLHKNPMKLISENGLQSIKFSLNSEALMPLNFLTPNALYRIYEVLLLSPMVTKFKTTLPLLGFHESDNHRGVIKGPLRQKSSFNVQPLNNPQIIIEEGPHQLAY